MSGAVLALPNGITLAKSLLLLGANTLIEQQGVDNVQSDESLPAVS
ncbi:hypothetical protein [Citrobacter koseri]|nr:hypothetical protein [Citrobacter koseri]